MKVSVVQMCSVDSWELNLRWVETLLGDGEMVDRDLICFPENCLYFRIKEKEEVEFKALAWEGFGRLSGIAREIRSNLHLGSVPLEINGRRFNSSVYIGRDGSITATYQKMHLFDIHLTGKDPITESDIFAHGESTQVFEHEDWRIGQSICYDLRFAELYSKYAQQEVDVILIPSAFLVTTGQAHWDILVRARAIENQAFVLASCQGGTHKSVRGDASRETYGHSMIVSPWGEVIDRQVSGTGVLHASLDKDQISKVRTQIPMSSHRRIE